jgi:hypothetical protein
VIATPAINEAAQAFEYARRQDPDRVTHDEYSVIISQLQPSLKSGAKVEKCWDLNYPEPQYSFACKVDRPPHSEKQIYLFITLMASCGEAFCRYVIYPLSRRASDG